MLRKQEAVAALIGQARIRAADRVGAPRNRERAPSQHSQRHLSSASSVWRPCPGARIKAIRPCWSPFSRGVRTSRSVCISTAFGCATAAPDALPLLRVQPMHLISTLPTISPPATQPQHDWPYRRAGSQDVLSDLALDHCYCRHYSPACRAK